VYIGKATLKDLKARSTYANSSKRLWTLPSASVRTDLLVDAAKAIAEVEQSLLPSFGGRSWEVTCQLGDPGPQILFRAWKGRMELAALPHLMEKIPQPPIWPGRKSTPDEYEEGEEDDPLRLQQREISTLSQVAWDLRDKYPIPPVSLKWQSPERKIFYSRKSAWEHATAMAAREVEINKTIFGIGSSGKLLQPFVPSEKTVLQVGQLRFERDGLWVVGQELEWQEDRPQLMEEAEAAEEERRLNLAPTNGLELFLATKRQEYVETHEECETVQQVEAALRKVWKKLSKSEKNEYQKHFKTEQEENSNIVKPKRPRKQKDPKPEPIKLSISPLDFYVQERRLAFVEERRIKRPGWGDMKPSEVDIHLRQEWKELPGSVKKEWTDKVIAIETEKLEEERKKREAEEEAIREKEEAERKEREARENAERERADAERKEREVKEAAKAADMVEAEAKARLAKAVNAKDVPDSRPLISKDHDAEGVSDLEFPVSSNHEDEKKEDDRHTQPLQVESSSPFTSTAELMDVEDKETQCPNKWLADMLRAKRVASARLSKRIQFPTDRATTRWCLNQDQIDKCFVACMDHYDTVMRTVKARDLHRELQDGFDVFRERGFGRYDMELPVFEDPNDFGFLTDMSKSPWMPVVKAILGEDALLIHKGCFLSMPGSAPQEYHQDGVHLTSQTQKPCHAINVFIPLVDLTSRNGPTEFCLGSHILGLEGYDRDFVDTPTPKAGNPVIFDYRLGHRGLGNSSQSVRPVVYVTYARAAQGKEFRDSVNFSRKRYHKIGELKTEAMSREERKNRRKRSIEDREAEDLERHVVVSI
jgi:hypothetical protein